MTGIPGAQNIEIDTTGGLTRLRFTLTGPPAPALAALAHAKVTALTVREPSLEEIFLDFYGTEAV